MSELKVNKVTPRSGTTVTIGDSGEHLALAGNIGLGGATPTTSGTGITFPATASASTNANTLDDYEEGTFTPVATGATTAGTTTHTGQFGYYTKIGRQVNATGLISWSALTGTGALNIGGFPFTFANLTQNYIPGVVVTGDLNWTGGTSIVCLAEINTTFVILLYMGDDLAAAGTQCVNESASVRFSITYFV